MIRLLAAAVAALFVVPAFAGDCPALGSLGPLPADDMLAAARATGDTIADDAAVKGGLFDRVIIDIDQHGVWMWLAAGGCIVARPILIGPVQAPPPEAKPALRGSGLEIGA